MRRVMFALLLCVVFYWAMPSPARAGDWDLWKGLRFTNCNYSPKTDKNDPQYTFLLDHTSGRGVAVEIDGTLRPAKLTFILE